MSDRTKQRNQTCDTEQPEHCITCSDEAIEAEVIALDEVGFTATVRIGQEISEVDVTLVEHVAIDDVLLVHAGVALSHSNEVSRPK